MKLLHLDRILLVWLFCATDCFALPAFQGAEGSGANATGGRGGVVYQVTNLNDSGTGSLRAACEASGTRTVVFTTGGRVQLTSGDINITNDNITIAGQTAPGDGICISGKNNGNNSLFRLNADNIIIQYLRLRLGKGPTGQSGDCITINNSSNVIIDHCSLSWSNDETIGIWEDDAPLPEDITVQYCIISEGLTYDHTSCGLIAGSNNNATGIVDIDFHHNFVASNENRNPLFKIKRYRIVNNIIYNWRFWSTGIAGGCDADIINNIYKKGPASGTKHEVLWRSDTCGENCGPQGINPSIYIVGNYGPYQSNPDADNWGMIREAPLWVEGDEVNATYQRGTPLTCTHVPITAYDVNDLNTTILDNVGAYRHLNENGDWVPCRDSVDTRVVQDYWDGDGPSSSEMEDFDEDAAWIGGYPTYSAGTPYTDADQDGMPATWETAMGLSDACATDRNGDLDSDGYTNLEEFLTGYQPPEAPQSFTTQGGTYTGATMQGVF